MAEVTDSLRVVEQIPQVEAVQLVRKFLRILKLQEIRVEAAYLYGSYATGVADADSDIDVAIVSPSLSGDRLQDWMRLTTTATDVDLRFEVVGFRPEQFRDERPLAWEIKTRGILIQ
ncbi:MAG: nucleotidyltransferase domain-containing protein [Caldilineales bacterium]|nr:nucleotidyltransferase domain-containing protein [Caldilineales bacterium]MCW5858000.1 nucleotidyltransferase domain-containing protein [Caldilineales bacterium]